jgi:hypothetical protein
MVRKTKIGEEDALPLGLDYHYSSTSCYSMQLFWLLTVQFEMSIVCKSCGVEFSLDNEQSILSHGAECHVSITASKYDKRGVLKLAPKPAHNMASRNYLLACGMISVQCDANTDVNWVPSPVKNKFNTVQSQETTRRIVKHRFSFGELRNVTMQVTVQPTYYIRKYVFTEPDA